MKKDKSTSNRIIYEQKYYVLCLPGYDENSSNDSGKARINDDDVCFLEVMFSCSCMDLKQTDLGSIGLVPSLYKYN